MLYYGSFSSDNADPLQGDRRHVFLLEAGYALVVKFVRNIGYATVKIWDTKKVSLDKTISSWRTRAKYDASVGEIMSAYSFADEAVDSSATQLQDSRKLMK